MFTFLQMLLQRNAWSQIGDFLFLFSYYLLKLCLLNKNSFKCNSFSKGENYKSGQKYAIVPVTFGPECRNLFDSHIV